MEKLLLFDCLNGALDLLMRYPSILKHVPFLLLTGKVLWELFRKKLLALQFISI
jgi:hypothetical protein